MLAILFTLGHTALNTVANICYKLSADSGNLRHFVLWQACGHTSGFLSVLSYTGLLHHVPLHVAFPLTQGLAVVSVQVIAARTLFRETIGPVQWLGTALIVAGIVLIGLGTS